MFPNFGGSNGFPGRPGGNDAAWPMAAAPVEAMVAIEVAPGRTEYRPVTIAVPNAAMISMSGGISPGGHVPMYRATDRGPGANTYGRSSASDRPFLEPWGAPASGRGDDYGNQSYGKRGYPHGPSGNLSKRPRPLDNSRLASMGYAIGSGSGSGSGSGPGQSSAASQGLAAQQVEPATDQEIMRVRALIAEAMRNILITCRDKGEAPHAETHGFLLSRVKEIYMQKHHIELDHRKFGCQKMRDIVHLVAFDLVVMAHTSQKAMVLMPMNGRDYEDVQALAEGPGLERAIARVRTAIRDPSARLPPMDRDAGSSGYAGGTRGPGRATTPIPNIDDGGSEEEGEARDPANAGTAHQPSTTPAAAGAAGSGPKPLTAGGPVVQLARGPFKSTNPDEQVDERVNKLVSKFCRRSVLALRFYLYMEAARQLRIRTGTGMYGVSASRAHRVVALGLPGVETAAGAADTAGTGGGGGGSTDPHEQQVMAELTHFRNMVVGTDPNLPPNAPVPLMAGGSEGEHGTPSAPLVAVAEAIAGHFALPVSELRKRWAAEAMESYGMPAVGALTDDEHLLAYVRELSAAVSMQSNLAEGMGPFKVIPPSEVQSRGSGAAKALGIVPGPLLTSALASVTQEHSGQLPGAPKPATPAAAAAAPRPSDGLPLPPHLMKATPGPGAALPPHLVQKEEGASELLPPHLRPQPIADALPPHLAGKLAEGGLAAPAVKQEPDAGEQTGVLATGAQAATAAAGGDAWGVIVQPGSQEGEGALPPGAGEALVVPALGNLWDVLKLQEVWNLLHTVLNEQAYQAVADNKQGSSSGSNARYPAVRVREDYKRTHGRALHIAPLGFANLVEFLQWGVYSSIVAVDQAMQKGEKGFLRPVFHPLRDMRSLLEMRMAPLVEQELAMLATARAEAAKGGSTLTVPPKPQLQPSDGYRMDAIKPDFKIMYGYDLDNRLLGFESFRTLVELNDDLVAVRTLSSTCMLLPRPLMRLRVLLRNLITDGTRAPMSLASVDAEYARMWGSPFSAPEQGLPSLTSALVAVADICQLSGGVLVPASPGAESVGYSRARNIVAQTTLGPQAPSYGRSRGMDPPQGPPGYDRRQDDRGGRDRDMGRGYSGAQQQQGSEHAAHPDSFLAGHRGAPHEPPPASLLPAGSGGGRLPPHPSLIRPDSGSGPGGGGGGGEDAASVMGAQVPPQGLGLMGDMAAGSHVPTMQDMLVALTSGKDPVMMSMLAEAAAGVQGQPPVSANNPLAAALGPMAALLGLAGAGMMPGAPALPMPGAGGLDAAALAAIASNPTLLAALASNPTVLATLALSGSGPAGPMVSAVNQPHHPGGAPPSQALSAPTPMGMPSMSGPPNPIQQSLLAAGSLSGQQPQQAGHTGQQSLLAMGGASAANFPGQMGSQGLMGSGPMGGAGQQQQQQTLGQSLHHPAQPQGHQLHPQSGSQPQQQQQGQLQQKPPQQQQQQQLQHTQQQPQQGAQQPQGSQGSQSIISMYKQQQQQQQAAQAQGATAQAAQAPANSVARPATQAGGQAASTVGAPSGQGAQASGGAVKPSGAQGNAVPQVSGASGSGSASLTPNDLKALKEKYLANKAATAAAAAAAGGNAAGGPARAAQAAGMGGPPAGAQVKPGQAPGQQQQQQQAAQQLRPKQGVPVTLPPRPVGQPSQQEAGVTPGAQPQVAPPAAARLAGAQGPPLRPAMGQQPQPAQQQQPQLAQHQHQQQQQRFGMPGQPGMMMGQQQQHSHPQQQPQGGPPGYSGFLPPPGHPAAPAVPTGPGATNAANNPAAQAAQAAAYYSQLAAQAAATAAAGGYPVPDHLSKPPAPAPTHAPAPYAAYPAAQPQPGAYPPPAAGMPGASAPAIPPPPTTDPSSAAYAAWYAAHYGQSAAPAASAAGGTAFYGNAPPPAAGQPHPYFQAAAAPAGAPAAAAGQPGYDYAAYQAWAAAYYAQQAAVSQGMPGAAAPPPAPGAAYPPSGYPGYPPGGMQVPAGYIPPGYGTWNPYMAAGGAAPSAPHTAMYGGAQGGSSSSSASQLMPQTTGPAGAGAVPRA